MLQTYVKRNENLNHEVPTFRNLGWILLVFALFQFPFLGIKSVVWNNFAVPIFFPIVVI